ncbi:MAG: DEAD/DEAH box helicase [Candidatus Xenobia bacterium]
MKCLSDRIRHELFHSLGWRELRPVQEAAIEAVLAGDNCLILAGTAQGKTEAAMLPVVECLLQAPPRGIAALYLSPLKALLNNQEPRLQRLMGLGGMHAFKWHGDVDGRVKGRFLSEPAACLMITPESLEVLLMSQRRPFGDVRFVIIDEIHAFAGDDRGDHLIALLERLAEQSRHDLQRIGLSATVGNPDTLLQWLRGSSRRGVRLVCPPSEKRPRLIEVHAAPAEEVAPRLVRGRKALVFAESRAQSERLKDALQRADVRTLVHHSSVSQALREEAETAFRDAETCCIVCTSTLELGLDVGDLDLVVQVGAPGTVSSFLQRMGRSGRRDGQRGHLAFITDTDWGFLQAVALVRLAMRGFVEPVPAGRRSVHIFLHQMFARILQHAGLPPERLLTGAGTPWCFADISREERQAMLDHLLAEGVLSMLDGLVQLGPQGEQAFGAAHFKELYSVFDTPRELRVRTTDHREVGAVEAWFLQGLQQRGRELVFLLGGRAWLAVDCNWGEGVVTVVPAPAGRVPTWLGAPKLLSRPLCEAIRELLCGDDRVPFLHPAAHELLDGHRELWHGTLAPARTVLQRQEDHLWLYTFAGGRINLLLGKLLEREFKSELAINNFWIKLPLPNSPDPFRPVLDVLSRLDEPLPLVELVEASGRGRLSKFQRFLPASLEAGFAAERLFDVPGARQVCSSSQIATATAPTA